MVGQFRISAIIRYLGGCTREVRRYPIRSKHRWLRQFLTTSWGFSLVQDSNRNDIPGIRPGCECLNQREGGNTYARYTKFASVKFMYLRISQARHNDAEAKAERSN